jgi:hypothetical protein
MPVGFVASYNSPRLADLPAPGGIPEGIVSDRCNVSRKVLDQHDDRRTEREEMEQWREFLDKLDL